MYQSLLPYIGLQLVDILSIMHIVWKFKIFRIIILLQSLHINQLPANSLSNKHFRCRPRYIANFVLHSSQLISLRGSISCCGYQRVLSIHFVKAVDVDGLTATMY